MAEIITIGIDPGMSGAIAALDPAGQHIGTWDMPATTDGKLNWVDAIALNTILWQITASSRPAQVIIERVGPMPKQGIASAFKFGVGFGSILATIEASRLPLHFVTPQKWKRALGLSSNKAASLHKARLLFPHAQLRYAKHEGRAEALLLAHYFFTTTRGAHERAITQSTTTG